MVLDGVSMALIASACLNERFASRRICFRYLVSSLAWNIPTFLASVVNNPLHCCLIFHLREWWPGEVLENSCCSGTCLFWGQRRVPPSMSQVCPHLWCDEGVPLTRMKCGLGNNEVVQRIRLHTDLGLFLLNLTGSHRTTMQELWLYPQEIL